MGAYIARRLLLMAPVLFVVGTTVFLLLHFTPGDPVVEMLGPDATDEQIAAMRAEMGLDDPIYVQYGRWLGRVARLDLGDSFFLPQSVMEAIASRAAPTVQLALYALAIALLIGIPAGVMAAIRQNSWVDRLLMVVALGGAALPSFFLAILLILLFAVSLGWTPSGGYMEVSTDPAEHFRRMALPAISLGFAQSALLARIVRASMLEVLQSDYVRTAKAKGLAFPRVVIRHALRSALIPTITVVGASLGNLLGGAIVIETVYTLPGMGQLVVQSIARRDYPIIMGAMLVIAVIYVVVNLLVDILYAYADPRIRFGRS